MVSPLWMPHATVCSCGEWLLKKKREREMDKLFVPHGTDLSLGPELPSLVAWVLREEIHGTCWRQWDWTWMSPVVFAFADGKLHNTLVIESHKQSEKPLFLLSIMANLMFSIFLFILTKFARTFVLQSHYSTFSLPQSNRVLLRYSYDNHEKKQYFSFSWITQAPFLRRSEMFLSSS